MLVTFLFLLGSALGDLFVIGGDWGSPVPGLEDIGLYNTDTNTWSAIGGGFPFRPENGSISEVTGIRKTSKGLVFYGYIGATVRDRFNQSLKLQNIALYDFGLGWDNLHGGVPGGVSSAVVDNNDCVVVSGAFLSVGTGSYEIPANYTAKWCSSTGWQTLGLGLGGNIKTNLLQWYILRDFAYRPICNLTEKWYSLVTGRAIHLQNNMLYVSGLFSEAGNVSLGRRNPSLAVYDFARSSWLSGPSAFSSLRTEENLVCCSTADYSGGTPAGADYATYCDNRAFVQPHELFVWNHLLVLLGNWNSSVLVYDLNRQAWSPFPQLVDVKHIWQSQFPKHNYQFYAITTPGAIFAYNITSGWTKVIDPRPDWRIDWIQIQENGKLYSFGRNSTTGAPGWAGQMLQEWTGSSWIPSEIFLSLIALGYRSDYYVPKGLFL